MRVQTEEWRRFIPGVRMYKGKKTFFWNGEKLWDDENKLHLVYDEEERETWEVIIVLPGVEVIPEFTFHYCENVKTVIMSDSVKRIEEMCAFSNCKGLKFVRLSRNLEYIGDSAFWNCKSLTSIFIPPSCREIGDWAFHWCEQLIILGSLPQHVDLGDDVFQGTGLLKASPFSLDEDGFYDEDDEEEVEEVVQWIMSINNEEAYALHRACSSFNPIAEIIHRLVKQQGLEAMRMPNSIGITPSQYLEANTFADISEKEIVNRYILDMMGEIVLPR